jgi:uncharacterized protein (TIGR02246 family)
MRTLWLLVLGVAACGGRDAAPTADPPAKSTDRAAEERAIRALGEQHAQAVASKDTAHVGDIYTEDVVYLPADGAPEHGRDAVRAAWTRGLNVPSLVIRYTPEVIEVAEAGDLAYERGLVKITQKNKPMYEGNYVYIWKKRDGQWHVPVYTWNTRRPE